MDCLVASIRFPMKFLMINVKQRYHSPCKFVLFNRRYGYVDWNSLISSFFFPNWVSKIREARSNHGVMMQSRKVEFESKVVHYEIINAINENNWDLPLTVYSAPSRPRDILHNRTWNRRRVLFLITLTIVYECVRVTRSFSLNKALLSNMESFSGSQEIAILHICCR